MTLIEGNTITLTLINKKVYLIYVAISWTLPNIVIKTINKLIFL